MHHVILTVAPVFGLIFLGYLLGRFGLIGAEAGKGLADFVFVVAMPVLLFRTILKAQAPETAPWGILTGFFAAMIVTWVLTTLVTRRVFHRDGEDAAAISMGACFGNTVMLGVPLAIGHFGERAATPLAIIIAAHTPILWLVGTLQMELARREGSFGWGALMGGLVRDLARNPIILGVLAGLAWRLTGLGLHPIPDKMISLLADAAIPGALFALGLSLTDFRIAGQVPTLTAMIVLKLVVMPLIAWVLLVHVLGVPPVWAGVGTILAAVPTGANAFLFANRYERATGSVSGAIALGTVLAAVTVSVVLLALGPPVAEADRPQATEDCCTAPAAPEGPRNSPRAANRSATLIGLET